jgi:LacI family transcriptional regulator
MRAWKADGIILLQDRLAEVRSLRIPKVVAIGTRRLSAVFPQVVCADESIGKMGAEALLDAGLRNFAFCGLTGLEFSDDRAKGFAARVREAGFDLSVYSAPTQHLGKSWYEERKRLSRWLGALSKPAGLMACNDDRARMVVELCRNLGIRVPDDVAILGVDNDEQVCNGANPPLSSVALATQRGGHEAAALLDSFMRGKKVSHGVVTVNPTHVVARQSTDTLAIANPAIVRAVRHIRDHAHLDVRVADLPLAAGVSRRTLQDRFKEFLGRTPLEEIHRTRVDRIARLLVETSMTISEISAASGFEIDAHVSRFFSRHTGVTPIEYRRRNRTP